MCVCAYSICMQLCISLSACVYVCVCIHMYTRAYSCIQIQICARTQIHKCTHVSVGACMMEGTCCECAHTPPASRALPCAPCVTPDLIRSSPQTQQKTCLHYAVEHEHDAVVRMVRMLLEAGADVAAKDKVRGAVLCSRAGHM